MAMPSKVLLTSLQKDAEFSVVWNQHHRPDFIHKEFFMNDMKVSMDDTDSSKLFDEDDYYRQVILDKKVILQEAISSQIKRREQLAFSLVSSVEEGSMIKVGINVEKDFKEILSQVGPMTFLRIIGTLKGERVTRARNAWGHRGAQEVTGERILGENFDRRFDCSGDIQSAELLSFREEWNREREDDESEIRISFALDIYLEGQRPPRVFRLDWKEITQTLYEDDDSKDLIIATPDGEVKCHSCVLKARSDVFRRMLSPETGMIESKSRKIVLQDMTLNCLKNFIALLYGIEMSSDAISCDLTVELFVATEKYDVANLLKTLRVVLMEKGKEWYTPDAILNLFGHVNHLETEKTLRNHLIQVMHRITTEIKACDRYKEMTKSEVETLIWALHEDLNKYSRNNS